VEQQPSPAVKPEPKPSAAVEPKTKETESYDKSIALYRDGKYEEAIERVQDVSEDLPEIRPGGQCSLLDRRILHGREAV